jgi:hypothetical protein
MIDRKLIKTINTLAKRTNGNRVFMARLIADGPEALRAHADKHALSCIARIEAARKKMVEGWWQK